MDTSQNEINVPSEGETKKKRSPWLIVVLILLIISMCCCVMGAILCRGGAMLPDFLDRFLTDVPGFESGEYDFWGLVEEFADSGDFDFDEFFPDGQFPDDFEDFMPSDNICQGLSGELELQIKIGPAEGTGLEPLGIGSIPLSVESSGESYYVTGSGTINYQDTLEEEWGYYIVSFDSTADLDGTCVGDEYSGILNVIVFTEGEQMIQVVVGADEWNYPWSGEYEFNLEFPIQDGAISSGEGWAFILHLD